MASCSANGSKGHHRFTLNVWESSTDGNNNKSTVTWELYLSPIQTGWDWARSGVSYSVTVDGTTSTGSIYRYDGSSNSKIASGSKTITHNDDGSKTISFKFKITDTSGQNYTSGNAEANGSLTLTKFNRQAVVTNATDFTDETNPTITFNKSGGYRINARLEFGGTFIQRDNISNTGTYTFDLTAEERELLRSKTPNSNSMTVREVIGTCINSSSETHWSWKDKTMTIVNGNPIFEDFTYQDTNADVVAITENNQAIIKGLSNLQVSVSVVNKMTTQKYATPVKYVSTIDTLTNTANYSDENNVIINLGEVNSSGTKRLSVRAYDSRNNSTEAFYDINVYEYEKPTINATVERENNFEANTTISINGTYSSLKIDNIEKNTITEIKYRYCEKGGTWSQWENTTFSASNGTYSATNAIVSLDSGKEFDVEIKVVDNFQEAVVSRSVDVGKSIFFISSNLRKCFINNKEVLVKNDDIDYTFEEDTREITFDVDINPGETYDIIINGGLTSRTDLLMKINNQTTGYYQAGYYFSNTASSDTNLSNVASYRANKQYFYWGHTLGITMSKIVGKLSLDYEVDNARYVPRYDWQTKTVMSGDQFLASVSGFLNVTTSKITSIYFVPGSANVMIKAGTRIQIIKSK